MSVWLERFVLTVLAGAAISIVFTNPFKFDRVQQVSLVVALVASALFTSRTVERMRQEASEPTAGPAPPLAQASPSSGGVSDTPQIAPAADSPETRAGSSVARSAAPKRDVTDTRPPSATPQPLPEIAVEDFAISGPLIEGHMRLKNFGGTSWEGQVTVQSLLAGNAMTVFGDRPDTVFFPAGGTRMIEFGPMTSETSGAVLAGEKSWEVVVEVRVGAPPGAHGYRYRAAFLPDRNRMNVVEEKRW